MLKHELRTTYKEKRKLLSPFFISKNSIAIANQLLNLHIWSASYYHIFLTIAKSKEVDTEPIITLLQARDKDIVLSKVVGKQSLKNYLLTDGTILKKNKWQIPEPVDGIEVPEHKIDIVFVPLLAFDKKGQRVGYGKGFYDTFLRKCRADVLKIGLSFFEAEEHIEDVEENDVPLNYCVTPKKIYEF
ncbi:5-formyltetrahydrofolate cyclo-ligase [Allomuricauda sp. d1]|uniref:5-formyltetrahydrofolate cyclo-ligase n=1 Tax=Allomuricauda sp. d1 TaxID=3136725 RepID=UPI0031DACFC3